MLTASNISVVFSDRKLFENVNIKFVDGNSYGIIGANGAGKSTFLKVLSKEISSTTGDIIIEKNKRLSVLQQDHYKFDEYNIIDTVIMGHKELYDIIKEREVLYSKAEFTEEDGYRSADLEEAFANLNGWEAESEVIKLLNGLNLEEKNHETLMKDLSGGDKVKVLLAQSLFGNPDILLLDEPTNHLDFYAIKWLENFLNNFNKTVIIVSHDRHFLNNVCTHIVDIDYMEAKLYVGNYDFWRESSLLAQKMLSDSNAKKEDKIKELENFIARFSANASKSSQATSRKKQLEKITIDDIKPSSRKYPYIHLPLRREIGKEVVKVENLCKTVDGEMVLNNVSFEVLGTDKVIVLSKNEIATTALLEVLTTNEFDSGTIEYGLTVEKDYLPKDNSSFFSDGDLNLVDWLRQYTEHEQGESYARSFLGKMLFSGEQALKKVKVLSGGEKVRMMFSKLMLSQANTLILDQPTNHLDLESIQALNEALIKYEGSLIFSSHDYSFIETIANKVVTLTKTGAVVFEGTFEEYLSDEKIKLKIEEMDK